MWVVIGEVHDTQNDVKYSWDDRILKMSISSFLIYSTKSSVRGISMYVYLGFLSVSFMKYFWEEFLKLVKELRVRTDWEK